MTEQEKELKRIVDLLESHLGDSDGYLPDDITQEELEEEFPVEAAMQIAVKLMIDARATATRTQGADDARPVASERVAALQDAVNALFHSRTSLEGEIAIKEMLRVAKINIQPGRAAGDIEKWKDAYEAEQKRVQRLEGVLVRELGLAKAQAAIALATHDTATRAQAPDTPTESS